MRVSSSSTRTEGAPGSAFVGAQPKDVDLDSGIRAKGIDENGGGPGGPPEGPANKGKIGSTKRVTPGGNDPHVMLQLGHIFSGRRFFRERPRQHEFGLENRPDAVQG